MALQRMGMAYKNSLVIGNFYPVHMGHIECITQAAVRSNMVRVLIAAHPDCPITGQEIMQALKYSCPNNVNYTITPDNMPRDNYSWVNRVHQAFPGVKFEAFFCGEKWGSDFAHRLGAVHEYVSKGKYPITSEALREDLNGNFGFLAPYFKRQMRLEVVMLGPECSGKTSLTRGLAQKYRTSFVPDVKRWYTEGIGYTGMEYRDLRRIADQQKSMLEIARNKDDTGLIFLDGDGIQLQAWSYKLHLGFEDISARSEHDRQIKVLCSPDFTWVQDGTRGTKDYQVELYFRLTGMLDSLQISYNVVYGSKMSRIHQVSKVIDRALEQRQRRFLPMPF